MTYEGGSASDGAINNMYIWGNTNSGNPIGIVNEGGSNVVLNTHYWLSAMPGYGSGYTYPHPLTGGGGGGIPAAPSSLVATKAASPNNYRQINLSWSDVANETGYTIERRKGTAGSWVQIATASASVVTHSDTTCGAGTTYYYRVRAYNANGNGAYSPLANAATDQVTSGGVGRWWMNEGGGTSIGDSSGAGNNGTLMNGVAWTTPGPGDDGDCLSFDGADDRVNVGSASSLDNIAAMTLCAWINPTSMGEGGYGRIVDKSTDTGTGNGWALMVAGTNGLGFRTKFSTTQLVRESTSNAITLGSWKHVVVTWNGSATASDVHIYVNGVEVTYGTTTNGSGTRANDSASNLSIGSDSTTARTFAGKIDRASIYNRVLSVNEILAIYRGGLSQ